MGRMGPLWPLGTLEHDRARAAFTGGGARSCFNGPRGPRGPKGPMDPGAQHVFLYQILRRGGGPNIFFSYLILTRESPWEPPRTPCGGFFVR